MGALTVRTASEGETEALGEALGRRLVGGEVLALVGNLGAGKTRFVKGLARGLGVPDAERAVTSPTFVLMAVHQGRLPLYHFDAYRLSGEAEFDLLEGGDFLSAGGVAAVEWAARVSAAIPAGALRIEFEVEGPTERTIEMTGDDRWDELLAGID